MEGAVAGVVGFVCGRENSLGTDFNPVIRYLGHVLELRKDRSLTRLDIEILVKLA